MCGTAVIGGYWPNSALIARLAQHGLVGDCKTRITGMITFVGSIRHIILLVLDIACNAGASIPSAWLLVHIG